MSDNYTSLYYSRSDEELLTGRRLSRERSYADHSDPNAPPVLPQGQDPSSFFAAIRIWDSGIRKRRVALQVLDDGIRVFFNSSAPEYEFWAWDAIKHMEFNEYSKMFWWKDEDTQQNVFFEKVEVRELKDEIEKRLTSKGMLGESSKPSEDKAATRTRDRAMSYGGPDDHPSNQKLFPMLPEGDDRDYCFRAVV